MTDLTDRRRQLADAIRSHGPEHFDIDAMYTVNGAPIHCMTRTVAEAVETDGTWTACVIGHEDLLQGGREHIYGVTGVNVSWLIQPEAWSRIEVNGWNMGAAHTAHLAAGADPRTAEWATVLDLLAALIKRDES
jgi:hypothetical protein